MSNEGSSSALMNTYSRFPVQIKKGKGSYVWDVEGNKYLDYTMGIATCNLGHVPDQVKNKVQEQLELLWHCSNLYEVPGQEKLATLLAENSCLDQVFFCNSGAEANEAAIKLAKKYAKDQGNEKRTEIVTFKQSFHGRTGVTMAATGQEKIHQGFTPVTPGFRYIPYNDYEALNDLTDGKTTAVLLELIQGEGGVFPAEKEWIEQLAATCKENDILLMIDEIQTGIGRTGTMFAYEQYEIEPDVITLAKGLASGFPMGAMLAKEHVAASFQPGTHGSTFGGNPIVVSAGIATIETIIEEKILKQVQENSKWLFEQMEAWKGEFDFIQEIRGAGFLIGIEMADVNLAEILEKFRNQNILVLTAGANTLRILPPLTTTREELNHFITIAHQVFMEYGEEK